MEFIRWYSAPVIIGFALSLLFNPLIAIIGFFFWLALVVYAVRRRVDNPEH
jgi:uncharacterized membrane protein